MSQMEEVCLGCLEVHPGQGLDISAIPTYLGIGYTEISEIDF